MGSLREIDIDFLDEKASAICPTRESSREFYGDMRDAIFPILLGDTFHKLPKPLQELHRGIHSSEWQGNATTRGAQNFAGRIIAALVGLPSGDDQTSARVSIEVTREGETWTRSFGGKQFRSYLSLGAGREAGLMRERFGIITVAVAITWQDGRLWFVPRHWRIGPLPLPTALLPKGDSFECVRDGSFAFDVSIEAPMLGLIAAYAGTLQLQPDSASGGGNNAPMSPAQ
ncbi:MAG: DUF4166 domain-containing protein [Woeseiaceae bacterium]|nr:DUF4166 domain-containing protein [Woeseiaceae bacterium]